MGDEAGAWAGTCEGAGAGAGRGGGGAAARLGAGAEARGGEAARPRRGILWHCQSRVACSAARSKSITHGTGRGGVSLSLSPFLDPYLASLIFM